VGDPEALGWTGRVTAAAWAEGLQLTPYVLGVRRQSSEDVVARMEAEARPRIAAETRLVLSFGANDATWEDGGPRVAPEASVAALRAALGIADRLALPAFVVGPPPVADDAHADRIEALSARMRAACPVPFVDVAGALRGSGPWIAEASAGDGAHPGAGGYAQLAELVRAPFLQWLRSASL
jgi:acyl-CoA thioesterase I